MENQWFSIPAQTFRIGFDDPESDTGSNRYFAWDNEREPYSVSTTAFEAQARPVSNEEYAAYLVATKNKSVPSTWTVNPDSSLEHANFFVNGAASQQIDNGDTLKQFISSHAIKTVYGPVALALALDWPLMSSYNEAEGYAGWAKARVPTLLEVRSIHEYAEKHKKMHRTM